MDFTDEERAAFYAAGQAERGNNDALYRCMQIVAARFPNYGVAINWTKSIINMLQMGMAPTCPWGRPKLLDKDGKKAYAAIQKRAERQAAVILKGAYDPKVFTYWYSKFPANISGCEPASPFVTTAVAAPMTPGTPNQDTMPQIELEPELPEIEPPNIPAASVASSDVASASASAPSDAPVAPVAPVASNAPNPSVPVPSVPVPSVPVPSAASAAAAAAVARAAAASSSSASAVRPADNSRPDILSDVSSHYAGSDTETRGPDDCPICFRNMYKDRRRPMTGNQCGHLVCSDCFPRCEFCCQCRLPLRGDQGSDSDESGEIVQVGRVTTPMFPRVAGRVPLTPITVLVDYQDLETFRRQLIRQGYYLSAEPNTYVRDSSLN